MRTNEHNIDTLLAPLMLVPEGGDELQILKDGFNRLFTALTDDEKRALIGIDEARTVIQLGGQSKIDMVEFEDLWGKPLTSDELGLHLHHEEVWLRSAHQHGLDTGNQDHELSDLEDLMRSCATIMGVDRALAAAHSPARDMLKNLTDHLWKNVVGPMPDEIRDALNAGVRGIQGMAPQSDLWVKTGQIYKEADHHALLGGLAGAIQEFWHLDNIPAEFRGPIDEAILFLDQNPAPGEPGASLSFG